MQEQSELLFSELAQLYAQYKQEVPGQRQAWPQSIKERIFELRRLGVKIGDISSRTGISAHTIYTWNYEAKKRGRGFLPVKVVDTLSTVTVKEDKVPLARAKTAKEISTVTVTTPGGYRIEGLRVSELAPFFRAVLG